MELSAPRNSGRAIFVAKASKQMDGVGRTDSLACAIAQTDSRDFYL